MPDSSSSRPTVQLHRCEATIELGKQLTKELGLDQSVDTLGRWMAHYIAELIDNAEKASSEERPEKMQACCEAILKLWAHRQNLPDGRRPFQDLESMLRTLASLDPEDSTPRYFSSARTATEDLKETDESQSWLKLVENLDHSARILIRYCLSQASQTALDKSAQWVSLAEAAGADEGIEFPLIRMINQEGAMLRECDHSEAEKKRLEKCIERLDAFSKMARSVASRLRKQVQSVQVLDKKTGIGKGRKK